MMLSTDLRSLADMLFPNASNRLVLEPEACEKLRSCLSMLSATAQVLEARLDAAQASEARDDRPLDEEGAIALIDAIHSGKVAVLPLRARLSARPLFVDDGDCA